MKLIEPSFKIIEQTDFSLEGIYKQIELAGRTCYKSEDKITSDSAKKFVENLIKSTHNSVLEHGTIYLSFNMYSRERYFKYCYNPYSIANSIGEAEKDTWRGFVTTNYRVIIENHWEDDLKYLTSPTKNHEKRVCVKFICDRGILAEYTRHRTMSFSVESTRYCNYSQNKFNNEITYILPLWIDVKYISNINYEHAPTDIVLFIESLKNAEATYFNLLSRGWKPQQARNVLPNALKTEIIMTGFVRDWEHFFSLRCASNTHPQARELAVPLQEEFTNRHYI